MTVLKWYMHVYVFAIITFVGLCVFYCINTLEIYSVFFVSSNTIELNYQNKLRSKDHTEFSTLVKFFRFRIKVDIKWRRESYSHLTFWTLKNATELKIKRLFCKFMLFFLTSFWCGQFVADHVVECHDCFSFFRLKTWQKQHGFFHIVYLSLLK